MFVFDTIKIQQAEKPLVIASTRSIRVISAFGAAMSYAFLVLALNSLAPSRYIIAFGLYIFIFTGIWYTAFRKVIVCNTEKNRVQISYHFLSVAFRQYLIDFTDVKSIFAEERSHGQTIQKKFRLFIETEKKNYDLGFVNHEEKSLNLITSLKREINLISTDSELTQDAEGSDK